jgi:hypothetical protein
MNIQYEVIKTPSGNTVINAIFEDGHMLSIPTEPSNSDYQAYLNPQETVPSNSSDFSQPIGGNE